MPKEYKLIPVSRYARLRKLCLAFPEAVEKPFGGHTAPAFRVRDKIFCGTYQVGRPALNVKGAPGAQEALVRSDPERFFVPDYVGPKDGSVRISTSTRTGTRSPSWWRRATA